MKNQALRLLTQTAAAACLAAVAAANSGLDTGSDGHIVIKAGKVITLAGEVIENGTIVIEDGRVTAVGKDVKTPWNAEVKEFPNSVAFPGFVEALTNSGMDRANENIDVAPFLSVKDSIDPVNFYYEDALRAGITTINVQQGADCVVGGNGYVVKPLGMTVEAMTVRPDSGLAMAATPKRGKSRATQALALRRAFGDLRMYLEDLVQEKRDGKDYATREALYQGREPDEESAKGRPMGGDAWKVEGLELVPRWEIDEKQAPMLELVEGKSSVFFYCAAPMDVHTAVRTARENGFLARTTLVIDPGCWKAADVIAEAGVHVVLAGSVLHTERDPRTGEEIETFVPGVLKEKGIHFALQSAGGSSLESLWYQAALCVGHGLTRDEALAAVTTTPAKILGLDERVGSIAPGKDGNVIIFSGDPLSVTSHVEHVVLEGNHVYDRATDVRMRQLLTGQQPENTAPADAKAGVPHSHEEPAIEDDRQVDEGENEEEKGDDHGDDHDHDEKKD
jgi:imidazolonepropionase-like amidohydrolase